MSKEHGHLQKTERAQYVTQKMDENYLKKRDVGKQVHVDTMCPHLAFNNNNNVQFCFPWLLIFYLNWKLLLMSG